MADVLWGFHPHLSGPLGVVPIKIRIIVGTLGLVDTNRAQYQREGWTVAAYPYGVTPMTLRDQCRQRHGTPAYLCDPTRPDDGMEPAHRRTCPTCAPYYGHMTTLGRDQ